MTVLIAMLLQAAPATHHPVLAPATSPLPEQRPLTMVTRCPQGGDGHDIVVRGRTDQRNSQHLEKLDPRFERSKSDSGLFERRLSDSATMTGGGPKGSVGITLKLGFK